MGPLPPLRRALESLASLLAPDACAACASPVRVFTVFCAPCAETLAPAVDTRPGERAPYTYGGAVAQAIAAFKYEGRADLARPLGALMRRALGPLREEPPGVVVPVPLHRRRLAARGFNQAALLAGPVARDLGARFAARALARTRDTAAQATLGRALRLENVAEAFALRSRGEAARIAGRRVLLVDDVRTTGATLDACARALQNAGAADVRTLVLAVAEA